MPAYKTHFTKKCETENHLEKAVRNLQNLKELLKAVRPNKLRKEMNNLVTESINELHTLGQDVFTWM